MFSMYFAQESAAREVLKRFDEYADQANITMEAQAKRIDELKKMNEVLRKETVAAQNKVIELQNRQECCKCDARKILEKEVEELRKDNQCLRIRHNKIWRVVNSELQNAI